MIAGIKRASLFKRRFKESFITQDPGFETNQKSSFLLPAWMFIDQFSKTFPAIIVVQVQ